MTFIVTSMGFYRAAATPLKQPMNGPTPSNNGLVMCEGGP